MGVCVEILLSALCCSPGLYFPELKGRVGLEAQESLAVTLMSLQSFACDSIVTFPLKRSCLPKSWRGLFGYEHEILP